MSGTYLALYRKYRPETFADVIGQEHITSLLTQSIKQKKIAHAYLFCGGRGTGKTSVARIVARDIGCNPEDIIEIDAASNRGIDEIRELRDAVRTMPFSSQYKVYIIDEAHMLTKEAANALLKTLEEPPSHVIFILATTDPDKLPQTIVSRCQKVVFNQPDLITLSKQLKIISKREGAELSDKNAILIAKHGNNSYRDALGMLEQLLRISNKEINEDIITKHLGLPSVEILQKILYSLVAKDSKSLLAVLTHAQSIGTSPNKLYDELIEVIRTGLYSRVGDTALYVAHEQFQNLFNDNREFFVSKRIFSLLEKYHLIDVSPLHAWTVISAILLNEIDA
jgi:DNA polymerase-3 subunit gamma/tau